jgi:hypothetical protein
MRRKCVPTHRAKGGDKNPRRTTRPCKKAIGEEPAARRTQYLKRIDFFDFWSSFMILSTHCLVNRALLHMKTRTKRHPPLTLWPVNWSAASLYVRELYIQLTYSYLNLDPIIIYLPSVAETPFGHPLVRMMWIETRQPSDLGQPT